MKQPYSYYGGKQRLLPELLKLVPKHKYFCECFCGGATLFWGKAPSENEVLNDMNGHITNFFMQLKSNFSELQKLIHGTLHSETLHSEAKQIIFKEPEKHSDLKRAWAWWVTTNMSFSFVAGGGFAFNNAGTGFGFGTKNKRDRFTERYSKRLENAEIFNRDAIDLITLKDHKDMFFYIDPPYVSSNCGHYEGYTSADFINLLNCLQNIKGKFLMSSYPEAELMQYREQCSVENIGEESGWRSKDIVQIVSVNGKREGTKYKTECLTWNYPHPNGQENLINGLFSELDVADVEVDEEEF